MRKVVKISESDLENMVRKVLEEQEYNEQLRRAGTKRVQIIKSKTKDKKTLKQGNVQPELSEEQWEEFVNGAEANVMVSLMTKTSRTKWEEIKKNQIDLAVATVESFNETYPENKWNKVYCSNAGERTEKVPGEPKVYPSLPMIFPSNSSPSSDFFVDNYYETTPYFKEQFKKDVIDPIKSQLESMKSLESKPKMYLKNLNVDTSASRIPNTQSPDGKTYTFKELSKLRNDSALKYIKSQLNSLGVMTDSNTVITQNYKGQNGDGTSGPEWKKGSDKSKYEPYKYLNVDIQVIVNKPPTPGEDRGEETLTTKLYKVTFKRKTKGISIKIPLYTWIKKSGRKSKRHRPSNDICPAFD